MPPKIRLMKPSDMDQVSQIDGDSFSDLLTKLLHTTIELPPHEMEYLQFWRSKEPKGAIVEEENGRINGFVFCHARGRCAWIGPLAVRVDAQGRGTGKRLMMAGLSYLDRARVKVVGLDTFAQNPVSVSLYLKLGFQIVGGLLMLHAPRESLQVLDMEIPPESLDKFQWGPLERRDLSSVARMELAATGFQRRQDFEFLLDSGLGAGFAVRGGKEIAGYAFTSIRRKSGFISPIHLNPRCTKPELVTKLLLSACADWLEGKINGDALTFCRGDELRMLNILLNAGFRLRATMLTMHRTGAIGKGPVRTPYSIEKG